ncbi:Serine/threonine-protein kinase par-1 [Chytriomyces hyalinus]|nr:Serine/threonine-protein kinase par-1 [Chytriomyces hyalinus]
MLARKKVLGNYNVGKTVGQGAFSKVKLGVHKETGQKVAIKIIDKKLMAQKAAKAKKAEDDRRKRKEAEAAAAAKKDEKHSSSLQRPSKTGDKKKEEEPGVPASAAKEKENAVKEKESAVKEKENAVKEKEKESADEAKKGIAQDAPSFVASLQLEVQLMMRLDHPNVINLYSIMETEDECFVVMEYASGGELIEYIAARNYLSEREARKFFRQIISAMDHCHLASVVHRDLKLENLLLNDSKDILISDFGLGRTYDPDVQEYLKTFCGTPNYAAVELISGIPYNGIKSDIWAMGVALYVMMTGKTPFTGATISQLYTKIKAVDYKCPDYFSADLKVLLAKMLKKDPAKRADMEALRTDPWVNFEEIERPLRIVPKVTGISGPSQITQFITSITKTPDYTLYSIRQHTRDGRSMDGAGEERNRSVQMRRRSISMQPGHSNTGFGVNAVAIQGGTLGRNRANTRRFSNVGNVISIQQLHDAPACPPLPGKEEDALSPLPTSSHSIGRAINDPRRLSLQDGKPPPLPVKAILPAVAPVAISAVPGIITANDIPGSANRSHGGDFQPVQTRGRRATITLDMFGKGKKTPIKAVDESPSASRSSTPDGSSTSVQHTRRKSTFKSDKTVPEEDRELQVIRRMSMVSPERPQMAHFSEPSAGSTMHSTKKTLDEDCDADSVSKSYSAFSPTSSYFSPSTTTAQMPSDKEIEKWHEFNRPPKEIRSARYSFNPKTTSTLSPSYIFQDVHRVLVSMQKVVNGTLVFHRSSDHYLIQCKLKAENEEVDFDIEVCKVWLLQLYGVRIKKQGGSAMKFKEAYSTIVEMLNI